MKTELYTEISACKKSVSQSKENANEIVKDKYTVPLF